MVKTSVMRVTRCRICRFAAEDPRLAEFQLLASGAALIGANHPGAHLHAETLDRSVWDPDGDPAARGIMSLVAVHSLAHAVMTEVALDCGYAASSLKERLYVLPRVAGQPIQCGILIYTATAGNQGTLGGLVEGHTAVCPNYGQYPVAISDNAKP